MANLRIKLVKSLNGRLKKHIAPARLLWAAQAGPTESDSLTIPDTAKNSDGLGYLLQGIRRIGGPA